MSTQLKAVAILEVMWDWRSMTSDAGYTEIAPRHYRINPDNLTGSRLYKWCGDRYTLRVTNARPQLVKSAKHRGKPDPEWLSDNLKRLWPFDLVLVCGKVAQATYSLGDTMCGGKQSRVIEGPHPAARMWTRAGLDLVSRLVQLSDCDYCLSFKGRTLHSEEIVPF